MYDQVARRDHAIAEVAARQHGVVAVRQLRAAGLDKHDVLHRTRTARLHRVYRGVYAVGHPALSQEGRWMAVILACGGGPYDAAGEGGGRRRAVAPCNGDEGCNSERREGGNSVLGRWGAALSYRSAAELWRLLPPRDGAIDVSVAGDGGKKKRSGVRMHRSLSLQPAAVRLHRGIPVTTPARTIADLRRTASTRAGRGRLISPRELRRAIRQANVFGLPIGPESGHDRTRSDLERAFLSICRRYRLPAPEVNVRIGRHLVDFLWRDRRLVVESDGYRYHRGRAAFEDDRGRDLELHGHGYTVIRISERQVDEQPEFVAEVLAAELSAGGALARRDDLPRLAP